MVEVVVGIGVLTFSVFGIAAAGEVFARASAENVRVTQVAFLLEEGMELVRAAREGGWSANIVSQPFDTPLYPSVTSGVVTLGSVSEVLPNDMTRSVVLSRVYRDANDSIAPSGVEDPNTRKVAVTITRTVSGAPVSKTAVSYITNLFPSP